MDLILGIDFGTTNTVITYFQNNKPNILYDGVYKSIPSKIGIKNDIIFCGNYIPLQCRDIIQSFKISIGNKYSLFVIKRHLSLTFFDANNLLPLFSGCFSFSTNL